MNENNQGNQDNSQSIFTAGIGQTVATPSSTPVEPTTVPVASPTESVQTSVNSMEQLQQTAPMNSGNVEVGVTPVQQVSTPVEPVQTPVQQVSTPVEPVQTIAQQVSTPVEPVQTPVQQVNAPVEPVQTTAQQVSTPVEPVQTTAQENTVQGNPTIKINEETGQIEKGQIVEEVSTVSEDDDRLIKDKKGTSRFIIILFIILIAFIIGLPTIVDLVKKVI